MTGDDPFVPHDKPKAIEPKRYQARTTPLPEIIPDTVPFACDMCGAKFKLRAGTRPAQLTYHVNATKEKPFTLRGVDLCGACLVKVQEFIARKGTP